ncbi:MAG: response regulator transcription factor [bacterium]
MSHVLIVEDEANLRLALRDNLEDEGHTVTEAATLAAADAALAAAPPDLVVLDIMLPDGDGYGWCRRLRAAGRTMPVLMLTARSLEDDLITGLDAGADDYLTKPYRLRELLARVRALLRRAPAAPEAAPAAPLEHLGRVTLDRAARHVTLDGDPVPLTRTEYDLLAHLLDHPGRALDRDALLDAVWGAVVVDPRTVDNFVSNLKKKLDWRPADPWRITTVRGVGYRLDRDPAPPRHAT